MKRRVLALLLAMALIVGVFAACGDSGNSSAGTGDSSSQAEGGNSQDGESSAEDGNTAAAGPDDTSERYSFTVYYNYTGWSKQWGMDEASKYMSELFNIDVNWYGPDSDPDAKLNLMVSSDDLPEALVMDRGPNLNKIAEAYLQPLDQFCYPGNPYEENVAEDARKFIQINGKDYGIPNWAHKEATGGNNYWMINTAAYDAAGSPDIKTFEDLHQYCLKVKELGLKSYSGQDVYPFWCTNTDNGYYIYWPMYISRGNPNLVDNYYTQENGKIQYCLESQEFIETLKTANQWFNEGLFTAEVFTDSGDQFLEKVTNGRPALLWYDFSQDDSNNFRRTVREQTSGETSYEVLGSKAMLPDTQLFPPTQEGMVTYGAEETSPGWNVNVITKKAERPQRIFDLFSWMLSKDGSITQMYGPEGGLWEGKDEDGNPILKKPQSEFTSKELDQAGAWFWTQPADAFNIDSTKFAVNDKEKPENKNWVVDLQAHLASYGYADPEKYPEGVRVGQKFLTNENVGVTDTVDPQSDLGVSRQTIIDYSKAQLPKIIMAKDEAEFNSLVDDLLTYVKAQNVDGICAAYQEKHDANVELQGFSAYDPEYDIYKLKK